MTAAAMPPSWRSAGPVARRGGGPVGLRLALAFVAVAVPTDAVSTYNSGSPGWAHVDLAPALQLAGGDGAQAAVTDTRGRVVASTLTVPAAAPGVVRDPLRRGSQRAG